MEWIKRNSISICLFSLATFIGMTIEKFFPGTPHRSAVYQIPMGDRGQPWRVTNFQGKVYVLIEAPSMPEDYLKGKPRE